MMKLTLLKICIVSCTLYIIACVEPNICLDYNYENQFNYNINVTNITKDGINVDSSGQHVNLDEIDRLTNETERCLVRLFGNPPHIPDYIAESSDCLYNSFEIPFNRECVVVKIPDDWVYSCDRTQQLLPHRAPQELCNQKGLQYNQNCPCLWRAGIQDNSIVVTPNLYLYKDPLIRLTTGCNNPWAHSLLAKCAIYESEMINE